MLPCVCFSQSNWILCPTAKGPHWVVLVIVLTTRIRQPLSCLLATIARPNEFGFQKRRDHPQQWSNCLGPAIWIDVLQILNIFQYYRPLGSWSDQTLLNTSQSSPRLSKFNSVSHSCDVSWNTCCFSFLRLRIVHLNQWSAFETASTGIPEIQNQSSISCEYKVIPWKLFPAVFNIGIL